MADAAPLLRTLSPALRGLERGVVAWKDSPRRQPLGAIDRANLEGLADDLRRKAEALDVDRPLLIIMFMGGTGVGKSTLLNALAGADIAQASFTRPTTRDPVVYYHESIKPDRLDPALRLCRLAPHERPDLAQKILVDTPDIDSNDLANREKLLKLLPVADVVLYVGSQEKYHDQLGWDLFLEHRRRRAFAFVLNKWDRCSAAPETGLRPDEDLLRDLKAQGFENPLIFRTCAQQWADARKSGRATTEPIGGLPEGEQFRELEQWLEMGLSRLEIEAIKARGVSQLLTQVEESVAATLPPDLSDVAEQTRAGWIRPLSEEAVASAELLLAAIEPYRREIEHHFSIEGQRRFRGIMSGYLSLFTSVRYAGSTLRRRLSILPRSGEPNEPAWDLSLFTRACSDAASNRVLDARAPALINRLLVDADAQGFPLTNLTEPTEAVGKLDWRRRHAQTLSDVLRTVEQRWSQPTGSRRWVETILVGMANWLPPVVLLAAFAVLLLRYFAVWGGESRVPALTDFLIPFVVLLSVLIVFHLLVEILLPIRWPSIRGEFHRRLVERTRQELEAAYLGIPGEIASGLLAERRRGEKLLAEAREIADWLARREQSASIAGLYGR